MIIGQDMLWLANLAGLTLTLLSLALKIASDRTKSGALRSASFAALMLAMLFLPYALASLYVSEGWSYEAALGTGAFIAAFLVIVFTAAVVGAGMASE